MNNGNGSELRAAELMRRARKLPEAALDGLLIMMAAYCAAYEPEIKKELISDDKKVDVGERRTLLSLVKSLCLACMCSSLEQVFAV